MWRALILCLPTAALADSLVATRVILAQAVVTAEDVALVAAEIPDALTDPALAVGQEARVAIYPGRPVKAADLGAAAMVDRNQIVRLIYRAGALEIATEGRALGRGAAGDVIEVLNLASRAKVTGLIGPDGAVMIGNP